MSATYLQRGESLDYLNSTSEAIAAGTIISLVSRIGVAGTTIEPGELGSIHMMGVFEVPKTDIAEIPMGTLVYFDGTGIKKTATGTIPAGYAAADAAAADKTVSIALLG